ncbi:MAG: dienelactone hydrolase family protein [Chloroflexi bacterium]|nr:dienelactone hydrolase family protein [Chloroflexota bacterium]
MGRIRFGFALVVVVPLLVACSGRPASGSVVQVPGPPLGARVHRALRQLGGEPHFWAAISANTYVGDLSGPIQLHHGTADHSVPLEYSLELEKQIRATGKSVELYVYEGDDHNIAKNWGLAMNRSVQFMDK